MSVLPDSHRVYFADLFDSIYRGDKTLCAVAMALIEAAHLWDDLVDGDSVEPAELNKVLLRVFTVIAPHPLWDKEMSGLFYSVYLRWQEANYFEADSKATDHELAQSWMLRAGVFDLFVLLAAKAFGQDWAESIGPVVRRAYGEQLPTFIEEVRSCQTQR